MSELSNEALEQAIRNATDEELIEIKGIGPHKVGQMREQLGESVWADAIENGEGNIKARRGRLHRMIPTTDEQPE